MKVKAQAQGVARPAAPRWKIEKDELLRRHYPDYDLLMPRLPGRTRSAIKTRAKALKLQKPNVSWTGAEIAQIRRYAQTMTRSEIFEKHSHRTPKNLDRVMDTYGIRPQRIPLLTSGDPLLDAARQRCRDTGLPLRVVSRMAGPDRTLGLSTERKGATFANDSFARAIDLLGGELYAEWDD